MTDLHDLDRVIAHLTTWPALAAQAAEAHPYPLFHCPPQLRAAAAKWEE